jgi:LmbE family N-acetylglucosaminyl deacetylase
MNNTPSIALSFLAHPDDAEFLCAGTLARLTQVGWTVHIATATAGDCGTMDRSAMEISTIRIREAENASALIGAHYHCLDERDGLVVYDKLTLRKTIDLFRRIAPTLVFTHAPKDYMMDHEMVSLLARAASFVYSAPNISTIPRADHSMIPYLYYCDPIGGMDHLGQPVEPTTLVDITPQMDTKIRMLACHNSQRQWLQAHHGMDEYLESMKRHAAWRGQENGTDAAEGFIQHRGHAYPHDDRLDELFGNWNKND